MIFCIQSITLLLYIIDIVSYIVEEDDVVRCHYCDGGLRQWEPGDDPWTEHARWFPFCKYIVKIKGLAFIEEVARHYSEMYSSDNVSN